MTPEVTSSPRVSPAENGDAAGTTAIDSPAPRARPIRRRKVAGVIRQWLATRELSGAELIRAQIMLALARELDDPAAPRYARPRVAAELRALLVELEADVDARPSRELDVRQLLQDAFRGS